MLPYVTFKETLWGPDTTADRRLERDGDVSEKLADEILHCKGDSAASFE